MVGWSFVKKRYNKTRWGFIICKSYVTPTFLYFALSDDVLCFIPWTLFTQYIFKIVLFEMIQTYPSGHAIYANRQYDVYIGVFERELIHPEISFCEINFCVYWFLEISPFIGKSVKIYLHQICFIFLYMQRNPFKVFVEFVI